MGDDIRKINWTITAKLGKPYIKELHANRELSVCVTTLLSASLYFGEDNKKQKTLTQIATILAYAAQYNLDLFTGITYSHNNIYSTPPTKQIYHIEEFSKKVFETNVLKTTLNYESVFKDLFQRLLKPSLLFVIGDFLEEIDLSLLSQKHEVIAIIVRDREEEFPVKLGEVLLQNPQSSMKLNTYFAKKSIDKYREKLLEHDRKMQEHFSSYGIRSIKIFTDEDAVAKLLRLFI
ncbi:hypothetical protein MNB_SV-5-100 [hydrothermal vent metagenome]|uniref:DUF58 domain-containing protein n=1 Tax=hydrothermal vent metagenome TaxID=652676 RepID=A0A1W1EFP7_9ZZZZ